jgi:hypothetical protein
LIWDYATSAAVEGSPAPTLGRVYVASPGQLYCFVPDEAAGVEDGGAVAQGSLDLKIGPNPGELSTIIQYSVPVESRVSLRVYDVRGRLVKSVFEGLRAAGHYRVEWNGRNDEGREAAAGIYFVRLDTDRLHVSKKAVLVR